MNLLSLIIHSPEMSDRACAENFATKWSTARVGIGTHLALQEDSATDEFFLMEGRVISSICDPDGKEVCVGFYVGPCVITPNIARTRNGVSLVSITATTDATVARLNSDLLTKLMLSSEPVRDWANGILRKALGQKADRAWCLAALGGSDRLEWFRENFPGYEGFFNHALIASFLGVTPVTLSRLRSENKRNDTSHRRSSSASV